MLESDEPGARGNGRALYLPGHLRTRQHDVDEVDLDQRDRLTKGVDRQLLADVIRAVAEHGFPREVQGRSRVLKFDADLAPGYTVGGAR